MHISLSVDFKQTSIFNLIAAIFYDKEMSWYSKKYLGLQTKARNTAVLYTVFILFKILLYWRMFHFLLAMETVVWKTIWECFTLLDMISFHFRIFLFTWFCSLWNIFKYISENLIILQNLFVPLSYIQRCLKFLNPLHKYDYNKICSPHKSEN